ncbi:SGNH/GDSL hydrolase family protein [Frigoribacterium sp. 2-23]|uniref:SGNH/GDSL hydrolase family protein n=1 Tax=Frigoribacterium sp. 2-23 TaxID=3415006 RepID=UPI003C6F7A27
MATIAAVGGVALTSRGASPTASRAPSAMPAPAATPSSSATPAPVATPAPAATPSPSAARAPAPTPTRPESALAAGSPVVTIGDSIMAGYGLDDPATSAWPVRLAVQTGAVVVNDSCSGAGFISFGDCGTTYAGLVAAAAAAHPGLIVIQSSDNDLGEDPSTLAAATNRTVQALRAAVPNARIVGLSTLWNQPGAVPAEVSESSDDLRLALAAVGGSFIDIGQPLAGHSGMLQDDDEHPTDAGQEALATAILADLRASNV